MELKEGTEVCGIRPETLFAMLVAEAVVNEEGVDFVVTSCTERSRKHSKTSLHWPGCASDFRSRTLHDPIETGVVLRGRLQKEFDVIVENDHIHVEFQPEVG